jgi:RNA-directed DNA polymerase
VVAINTTPEEALRKEGLQRWLKRTQEVLAHRSLQGHSFHRLFNLMRTKRLVELALDRVLRNDGAKTAGVDGKTKRHLKTETSRAQFIDALWRDLTAKTYRPAPVRRVYIPKANGEQRPLGMPMVRSYCPPYRLLSG